MLQPVLQSAVRQESSTMATAVSLPSPRAAAATTTIISGPSEGQTSAAAAAAAATAKKESYQNVGCIWPAAPFIIKALPCLICH